MKTWWWAQPPFLHIPVSLRFMANAQAAVSYAQEDSDKGEQVCTLPWASFTGHLPVLLLAAFLVFCISSVSLWYFSHSYAQMQYANPFAPEACLHDTRQQRPAVPMLALSYGEQQKDVSVAAPLKTWASICIVHYVVHCRRTQLSFPSFTSDLVMDLFWLKSFAVSAMPSIKKLNCVLKLSWVRENCDTK